MAAGGVPGGWWVSVIIIVEFGVRQDFVVKVRRNYEATGNMVLVCL